MTPDESAMGEIDKARSHPMRRRVLVAIKELGKPLSPVEFGRFIGKDTAAVAYHFRILHEAGVLDIAREEPVRGAIKHYYGLSKQFSAEVADSVALDRIADILDAADDIGCVDVKAIARTVFAAGRPVIGGEHERGVPNPAP